MLKITVFRIKHHPSSYPSIIIIIVKFFGLLKSHKCCCILATSRDKILFSDVFTDRTRVAEQRDRATVHHFKQCASVRRDIRAVILVEITVPRG